MRECVTPTSLDTSKSIGQQKTLPRDIRGFNNIKLIILELCEIVARRARQGGYVERTVFLTFREPQLKFPTRSAVMKDYTDIPNDIYQTACKLLDKHWDEILAGNVLWEKHRMCLPDVRIKASHRCKHCKFFVPIKGKTEVKNGCVVNIKSYGNMKKRIPPVVPVMEIVKLIGLEGLQDALERGDPETQSCGRFELKPK